MAKDEKPSAGAKAAKVLVSWLIVADNARRRSRQVRKWVVRLVLLALVGGAIALLPRALQKPPIVVKTVKVDKATVKDVVVGSSAGEIVPAHQATVRAELGARVIAVKKRRGDRVKAGEVIVLLDGEDMNAREAEARARVDATRGQVAQAEARLATLAKQAERARMLAERGAGTSQLSEDAQAAVTEAKEAIAAARSLVAQSEAAVRVARVAQKKAALTAPFSGLLVEVTPDPGDELSPGAAVFEIMDDSRLRADATIDEADAARVKEGQLATLTLDAIPGKVIVGKLSHVGPAVRKDLKGARTLPIEVEVSDPATAMQAGLKAGMSVSVEIIVAEKDGVVSLPTNVIVGRGQKRSVYVVENGVAHLRPIEVGLSNWDRTEILKGVELGAEVVATLNVKELEDGRKVTVGKLP